MQTYLQFGDFGGPYHTVRVENKESPMRHHKMGLSYTATGYGSKLPTRYKVKFNNRWLRVYSVCHSNTSIEYVIVDGERVKVDIE